VEIAKLPGAVDDLIVASGRRKNRMMMNMIAMKSGLSPEPIEKFGWNGDSIEAQRFADMAITQLCKLPVAFQETTGVAAPSIGGITTMPAAKVERIAA
jgi:anhydro-N-acetylmuramic acid kinase